MKNFLTEKTTQQKLFEELTRAKSNIKRYVHRFALELKEMHFKDQIFVKYMNDNESKEDLIRAMRGELQKRNTILQKVIKDRINEENKIFFVD